MHKLCPELTGPACLCAAPQVIGVQFALLRCADTQLPAYYPGAFVGGCWADTRSW